MALQLTIRDARPDDAAALAAAERIVAARPGSLASGPDEIHEDALRSLIQNTDGKYLVAEHGGQLVGHAVLVPMSLAATRHILRLTIVVHEGHEGQGIGRRLLTALIDWAKAAPHVRRIELNVRVTNTRAIGLYRSLGFEEQGRQPQRIRVDDQTFVDDLEMGLQTKTPRL